jgi:hypothetical protein
MMLIVSIVIALAIGLAITLLLRPAEQSPGQQTSLLAFLSIGVGFGSSSVWFFLWLVIFGPHRNAFIVSEFVILTILVLLLLAHPRRKRMLRPPIAPRRAPHRILGYVPAGALLASLAIALLAFFRYSAAAPHGAWDAWGDWNLRARFLYLGGRHWNEVFSFRGTMPHRDYPLLLSATVARSWTYLKGDTQRAPIAVAFLFTFATAGELFSSLALLRSRSQGMIAATLLLATPFFLVLGSAQYADVPLAFFFLSTIVLLCLHDFSGVEDRQGLALAGAVAGFAVWTKNEGGLFLLCLLTSHLVVRLRTSGFSVYKRELLSIGAGLLPVLSVVAFFKIRFAWHTDLLVAHGMWHRLSSIERYRVILVSVGGALLHFGSWSLSLTPLLALYALLLGIQKGAACAAAKIGFTTIALTALGYFFIYVTAWVPLQWLLVTSLTRLCIQLYPSLLFLFFLLTRTPEEILDQRFALMPATSNLSSPKRLS